eukprot:Opistho-2@36635
MQGPRPSTVTTSATARRLPSIGDWLTSISKREDAEWPALYPHQQGVSVGRAVPVRDSGTPGTRSGSGALTSVATKLPAVVQADTRTTVHVQRPSTSVCIRERTKGDEGTDAEKQLPPSTIYSAVGKPESTTGKSQSDKVTVRRRTRRSIGGNCSVDSFDRRNEPLIASNDQLVFGTPTSPSVSGRSSYSSLKSHSARNAQSADTKMLNVVEELVREQQQIQLLFSHFRNSRRHSERMALVNDLVEACRDYFYVLENVFHKELDKVDHELACECREAFNAALPDAVILLTMVDPIVSPKEFVQSVSDLSRTLSKHFEEYGEMAFPRLRQCCRLEDLHSLGIKVRQQKMRLQATRRRTLQ